MAMSGNKLRIASMQLAIAAARNNFEAVPRPENARQALQNDRMAVGNHQAKTMHGRSSTSPLIEPPRAQKYSSLTLPQSPNSSRTPQRRYAAHGAERLASAAVPTL